MFSFKKEMERRISSLERGLELLESGLEGLEKKIPNLERELTDYDIWVNSIRIELTNLQITVKKIKDITGYDSYEYKTELVKKDVTEKTATEAMGQRDPEDLVPEPGQAVKFKK